jgi:hypothetical protein
MEESLAEESHCDLLKEAIDSTAFRFLFLARPSETNERKKNKTATASTSERKQNKRRKINEQRNDDRQRQ